MDAASGKEVLEQDASTSGAADPSEPVIKKGRRRKRRKQGKNKPLLDGDAVEYRSSKQEITVEEAERCNPLATKDLARRSAIRKNTILVITRPQKKEVRRRRVYIYGNIDRTKTQRDLRPFRKCFKGLHCQAEQPSQHRRQTIAALKNACDLDQRVALLDPGLGCSLDDSADLIMCCRLDQWQARARPWMQRWTHLDSDWYAVHYA